MSYVLEVDRNSPGTPSSKNCLLVGRICTNPPSASSYSLFPLISSTVIYFTDLPADDLMEQHNSFFYDSSCPIYWKCLVCSHRKILFKHSNQNVDKHIYLFEYVSYVFIFINLFEKVNI